MSTTVNPNSTRRRAITLFALLSSKSVKIHGFLGVKHPLVPSQRYLPPSFSRFSSSLSDDGDFALIGLNAELPSESLTVTSNDKSLFATDIPTTAQAPDEKGTNAPTFSDSSTPPSPSLSTNNMMGLTDDGDFILEGVNAIDPSANQALEKYGTPLVSPKDPSNAGDVLSQLGLTGSTTTSSSMEESPPLPAISESVSDWNINSNADGLTEDGDLAILGLNMNNAPPAPGNDNPQNMFRPQTTTTIQSTQSSSSSSANANNKNFASSTGLASRQLSDVMVRENCIEQVDDMTVWLLEMIPTLRDDDCIYYAEQLVSLGLDPDCVTASALRMEDLEVFMKPLHGRYLFQQLQQQLPHPPR